MAWVKEVFAPAPVTPSPEESAQPASLWRPEGLTWLTRTRLIVLLGGIGALALVAIFIGLFLTREPAASEWVGPQPVKDTGIPISMDAWSPEYRYSDADGKQQLLVYLVKDGQLQPAKLPAREHTDRMGTAALTALFEGPSQEQKAQGLSTALSKGVGIERLRYDEKRAVAFFTPSGALGAKDSIPFDLALAQLVFTLTQFPWIDYVEFQNSQGQPIAVQTPSGPKQQVCRDDLRGSGAASTTSTMAVAQEQGPTTVAAQVPVVPVESEGQPKVGMADFSVTVEPASPGEVVVHVAEGGAAAVGPLWQASGSIASAVATSALGLKLSDYRITYEVSAAVDGSGAGALMSVATMAALLGDSLKPDVGLVGSATPDLFIGPVKGIPQRLESAAQGGKRLLLIPAGESRYLDPDTGESIDVTKRGQDLGLQIQEVSDLYEAYQYLTGRALSRPAPSSAALAFSDDSMEKLRAIVEARTVAAETYAQRYADFGNEGKDDYTERLIASSQEAKADSSDRLRADEPAAAYERARDAEYDAILAWAWALVRGGSLDPQSIVPVDDRDDFCARLLEASPSTAGEAACLVGAWSDFALCEGLLTSAAELLSNLAGENGQLAGNLAVFDCATAITLWNRAHDSLSLMPAGQGAALTDTAQISLLAASYERAAAADLKVVDVLLVPQFAAAGALSQEGARLLLSLYDHYYERAAVCLAQMETYRASFSEGPGREYALLGAALASYLCSSVVLTQDAGYVAQYENGVITGFAYGAPDRHLEVARDWAEAAITGADATAGATVLPVLWHAMGSADGEGGPGLKMQALLDFWTASSLASLMQTVAGRLIPLGLTRDF